MKAKITYYLSFLLLLFSLSSQAQITDDFTDGNFTFAPTWSGTDTDFVVNASQQLQLNSSGTDTSYLSLTNTQSLDNCEWRFWVKLSFSPSSSNFARAYLVSNQQDLRANAAGYYLQFGEAGTNDQVELFKTNGTTATSVCRGTTIIANAFAIGVKVTRDNTGLWKILIDPAGGTNYVQEASGTDNTYKNTSFFGVLCNYTNTNATKFYFDNFYVYSPPDVTPPMVDSVALISSNQIDIYFTEALSLVSAQTTANYSVNNGIAYAVSATRDASDFSLVHTTFGNYFTNGQTYTLTVTGVQDLSNNTDINDLKTFTFFVPQANDVVINEIMADPDPVVGLPDYEYVELFNRTHFPVRMMNWTFSAGSSTKTFPDTTLVPDGFLILCKDSAKNSFQPYGTAIGLFTSASALTNTGTSLVLRDNFGNIIHSVSYSDTWYQDAIKQNGGWSLEQIDPNAPCGGKANWRASLNNSGGTPGKINSINASAPDVIPPKVSYVTIISSNTIQVFFDEFIDSTTLTTLSNFTIDKGMGNPTSADPVEPDYTSVIFTLSSNIQPSVIYTLTAGNVKDCAGNIISSGNTVQFAIPELAYADDIVVNEILFDPNLNGVDWVEIYNRSNKVIDLKEINICNEDAYGNLINIKQIAPNGRFIFPQSYMVMSVDQTAVKNQYNTTNPSGFVDMPSMISLNNDSSYVVLVNMSQQVIDKLQYHSDWHLPLMSDTKGFSLERINYENPTQDQNNWHTASESSGGATPAYKNSQYTDGEGGSELTISPEVFSPDNDGINDVLSISYAFDAPGMIGNIHIYDSRGRLTKTLIRNELLATSGTFFWDGITDEKTKARIGIYIIYFEAFDTKGKTKKFKKSCVVGGKF